METLYINNTYCSNVEQLKAFLSDRNNQVNKGFRNEILAFFRDGVLEEWHKDRDIHIEFGDKSATDDKTFNELVKTITGNEVSGDASSKFNEVGELVRVEFNSKNYEVTNGKVSITNFEPGKIKFILKCLRPENNEFVFSFGEQTKSMIWNDYTRSQEVAMEFDVEKEGVYQLKEGKGNTLSSIEINTYKTIDLGLSVYWADRNIGAEKPEDEGICDITMEEAKRKITEQFGKGWRLPSIMELRKLSDLHKIKSIVRNSIRLFEAFNNVTDNNDVITISSNNDTITLPKAGLYITNEENDYFSFTKKGIVHTSNPYKVLVRPVLDKK